MSRTESTPKFPRGHPSFASPRVSIGLPVYNSERFLAEALDSLLAQTFEDFELVISDNASTDRTPEICSSYAARDRRIRYYRTAQNRGASWNHERVFRLSRGEYFKWAAYDDICAPQYIQRCVEILDRMPSVVLCYAGTVLIDEHGKCLRRYSGSYNATSPKAHERFRSILYHFGVSDPMYGVIRAHALAMTRLLGHYVAADLVLLAELALLGEFYEVPEHLFLRRDHPHKSGRANPSLAAIAAWYDPANRGRVPLPTWRLFFETLSSIKRSQTPYSEKFHCYGYMVKWFRWNLKDLKSELSMWIKYEVKYLKQRGCINDTSR
jgi:glycosyltransferase involved in cell wall biosynthesis